MKLKIFFTTLITSITLCALKARACGNDEMTFFGTRFNNLNLFASDKSEVSDELLHVVFEKKSKTDGILSLVKLELPTPIRLELYSDPIQDIYYYEQHRLKLAIRSLTDKAWFKRYSVPDQRLTGPTFIHEYGHAVFFANLNSDRLPWNTYQDLARKYSRLRDLYHPFKYVQTWKCSTCCEYRAVVKGLGEGFTQEQLDEKVTNLERPIADIQSEMFTQKRDTGLPFYEMHRIMLPYTEFYSDLLASLVYDDPAVISVPINSYAQLSQEGKNRDFSNPNIAVSQDESRLVPHEWLAESRYELFKLVWNRARGPLLRVRF
ncbi:MAG: hypothetical protein KDD22_06155 [Bdellovibrionales bacterium]|nr:hypothetical protein [Bdellovibrionales bacterium]